jgi:hypothetical protein
MVICVSLGFHREVDENRALLGHYATSIGNFLPTFRDNLSDPFQGVKNPRGSFGLVWLGLGYVDGSVFGFLACGFFRFGSLGRFDCFG